MIETRVGLQAALNGDRTKAAHPATPVSVEELAREPPPASPREPARSTCTHATPRDARRLTRG